MITCAARLSSAPGAWSADGCLTSGRILRHFGITPHGSSLQTMQRIMPGIDWQKSFASTLFHAFHLDGQRIDFSERDEALWIAEHLDFNPLLRDAYSISPYRKMWQLVCDMAAEDRDIIIAPDHAYLPKSRNFELCLHLIAAGSDTSLVLSEFVEPMIGHAMSMR